LIRNTQRIADLRKNQSGSQVVREEIQVLEKKNLALLEAVRIVDDEAKRTQQLKFERTQRSNAGRIAETALAYDKEIARVRSQGGETGAIESVKELAVLREQLRIAREKGDVGRLDAEQIVAQIALKKADQAKFRADAGVERGINNALINHNPDAAKALENAVEREKLRDQYKANGLSIEQADGDFAARLSARSQPRVVADSLQSVGGGGSSAGKGIEYQRRTAEMTTKAVGYLATLAAKEAGTLK